VNSLVRPDSFDPAALAAALGPLEGVLMGLVLVLLAEGALLFAWSPGKVRERLRSYDVITVMLLVAFFVAFVRRILGFL
jgi:hypothetical protein